MGRFQYQNAKTDIDDRALAHLQIVIGNKLRRGEPFYFTWRHDPSTGEGRRSAWLHPGANFDFTFFGSRAPTIDRTWVEVLARAANSPGGLYVMSEPAAAPAREDAALEAV